VVSAAIGPSGPRKSSRSANFSTIPSIGPSTIKAASIAAGAIDVILDQ
jgi:hypothetical protein